MAGLKFSPSRAKSAVSMKIVHNARFRSYAARFAQIAFLSVKVFKDVTLASRSLRTGRMVRLPWKLYKTLFSGHAQHVVAESHLWALKFSKLAWNYLQNGKTERFPWKLYKTLFWGHAQHDVAKSNLWALRFSKSLHWPEILSEKGKQCAFHRNCTKRSFQVMRSTFWPNRIFLAAKFSKSWNWPQILLKRGKQCAIHENCTKRSFQVMRSTFWPNRIFQRQSSQNRLNRPKILFKTGKQCAFY